MGSCVICLEDLKINVYGITSISIALTNDKRNEMEAKKFYILYNLFLDGNFYLALDVGSQRMNSIDKSFDNLQSALIQSLKDVKENLKRVDQHVLQYEDKQKNVKDAMKAQEETLKTLATFAEKSQVSQLQSQVDDVLHNISILTQQEEQDVTSLEKEVDIIKEKIYVAEQHMSDVKERLNKVNTTLTRHAELRRSLRG